MKNVLKKIYKYSIIFVVCYTLLLLIFTLINHFTHDNFFCLAEYSAKSIIDYITLYLFYFDNIFIIICFILLVFYIFYFIYSIVKKKFGEDYVDWFDRNARNVFLGKYVEMPQPKMPKKVMGIWI